MFFSSALTCFQEANRNDITPPAALQSDSGLSNKNNRTLNFYWHGLFVIENCTRSTPIKGVSHAGFIFLPPTALLNVASLDDNRRTWLLLPLSGVCCYQTGLTEMLCSPKDTQSTECSAECLPHEMALSEREFWPNRTASAPQSLDKPLSRALRLWGCHSCCSLLLEHPSTHVSTWKIPSKSSLNVKLFITPPPPKL